ncbi:arylamine N-acetyltransferase [Nocardioides luteus]|uniref:Arylamine N-acetyltransferase n=1 Tax=Nocardioides luteus TaxID=1844 RepID=A0ABQ5SSL0_9ACTN|nr:arylamine N-acetyltransferase [Nocardioides luteus]MDR7309956.1 arylamine N-acetyltransferase [Nocardioides luteus]GGR59350.1 arylamine N-acetyltransferase [Nocardioides luteus]GLJ67135.1 arylamine N-acetyltransferase [Nocardioides luteus]
MIDGYLRRLGIAGRPEATYETLLDLHRRHLDTLPYDNLSIMLAAIGAAEAPDPVDPAVTLERVAGGGNAGYCFHHNGLVALVLEELGFEVVRRPGQLIETTGPSGELDHLALEVRGLPTAENPGGRWWPDLGFGDAFREPLPLVDGHHRQNGFVYRLVRVGEQGWTFHHDPAGSFHGNLIRGEVGLDEVATRHPQLSTPPGDYTTKLVVQRRDATGADTVRSIRHTRIGEGASSRELRDFAEWTAALEGLGLSLEGVEEAALRELHQRQSADYDEWLLTR